MEVERDVELEYGGDAEGGLSSGPRNMDQLPAYTDDEIADALGDVSEEIEEAFRLPKGPDEASEILVAGLA